MRAWTKGGLTARALIVAAIIGLALLLIVAIARWADFISTLPTGIALIAAFGTLVVLFLLWAVLRDVPEQRRRRAELANARGQNVALRE